jgi:hypothetical protein
MKFEDRKIQMTVRKIVKRRHFTGDILYDLYFSIKTFNKVIKSTNIIGRSICISEEDYLPTTDGYRNAKDIKVGDNIYYSLNIISD